MEIKSVCAVVVTHNRKVLLKRCLHSICQQSYPVDCIIVVDNCSTDNSHQYITSELKFLNNNNLIWKRLTSNSGGAGGFYAGINEFIQSKRWEYCWLMDDDGFPDQTCLENLMVYSKTSKFIGPIVIDEESKTSISFPFRFPQTRIICRSINDSILTNIKELDGVILPFNGVLLSKEIVKKVGLPRKEYFIWGDEMEYLSRIKANGFGTSLILAAKFYHPKGKNVGKKTFFGLLQFNDTDSDIKLYCYCRNNISNLKKYSSYIRAIAFTILSFWFYIFTSPSFKKLKIVLQASIHGWMNNFSFHKKFLNEHHRASE